MLVLSSPFSTYIDSLQDLSTMAQKQDRVYACGNFKYVAPSARLVIGFDDESYPSMWPQALRPHPELHVLPEPHQKRWRPALSLPPILMRTAHLPAHLVGQLLIKKERLSA